MPDMEKRGSTLKFESRSDDDARILRGYAAVFDDETEIAGSFIESIAPEAFDEALKADVRALIDHDTGRVIGRTRSGTLRLSIDERGLAVEIDVPDTADGRDLWTLVERGDVSGMSFGFSVTKQEWDDTEDMPKRRILGVELYEVSAVAFPAFDNTSIATRSLDKAREEAAAVNEAREAEAAARRLAYAQRKATQEQKFRGI